LGLSAKDSADFVKFLAKEAQQYNLAIGLKNAGDIIPDILPIVQFSVNEQCAEEEECDTFAAFTKAGKPVFNIEYPKGAPNGISASALSKSCAAARTNGFSTVLKTMELDGWVEFCNGQKAATSVS
jgi:endo-alpha-1,4-polygalactosaminidase (GH114 family)